VANPDPYVAQKHRKFPHIGRKAWQSPLSKTMGISRDPGLNPKSKITLIHGLKVRSWYYSCVLAYHQKSFQTNLLRVFLLRTFLFDYSSFCNGQQEFEQLCHREERFLRRSNP